MKRTLIFVLITCLLSLLSTRPGFAQKESGFEQRDPAFEEEIYARLRAINPEAVPIFAEATRLDDAGDYEKARSGFKEVLRLALISPTRCAA
jgi:hypothetical protein